MNHKIIAFNGLKSVSKKVIRKKENEGSIEWARKQFSEIAKQLKFNHLEDWYKVTESDLERNIHDLLMLTSFRNTSLIDALRVIYPEFIWNPVKFDKLHKLQKAPNHFWENVNNRRAFLDKLAKKLNFTKWEDWYSITLADFYKYGGAFLAKRHKQSFHKLLIEIYPELPWEIWRFVKVPEGYWDNPENVKEAFDALGKKIGIKQLEDWYNVTNIQIQKLGFSGVLNKYGLTGALKLAYPKFDWEKNRHRAFFPKVQHSLFSSFQELFPDVEDIHLDYTNHEVFRYKNSNRNMTFDIFVPSLSLALEYQGSQHYEQNYIMAKEPFEERKLLDEEKRLVCKQKNITLIELPYWQVFNKDSLAEILEKEKPGILSNKRK